MALPLPGWQSAWGRGVAWPLLHGNIRLEEYFVSQLGDLFNCYLDFCNDHLYLQPIYQRNI